MKMPQNTGAYLWGGTIGAIALAIVGFTWGGWVTGGTHAKEVASAKHDGAVAALAPICAAGFRGQADAPAKLTALNAESSWSRGQFVEKSGFALMPGSKTVDSDVARACAELLTAK